MARPKYIQTRTSVTLIGAMLCAGGCSLEDVASADANADTDTGNSTLSSGTGDDGGDVTGLTADTAGDDWTEGTGPGWDTDTDPTDADQEGTCNLDCGQGGYCDESNDVPTCVCDPGFASTGLDCVPCETIADGTLPGIVPAVRAAFEFSINGDVPPQSPYDFGRLELRNQATGDAVPLGRTNDDGASLLVVPGKYDVLYRLVEGGEALPTNEGVVLETLAIYEAAGTYAIDIPYAHYTGRISVNGEANVSNVYNFGRLWLVNPSTGDRVSLGDTRATQFSVNVVPGRYEIRYEVRENDGLVPANRSGLIQEIDIVSDTEQDIDVPMATYTGEITIDGTAVESPYEWGTLELRDIATGDVFPFAQTNDAAFSVNLIPGDYEVRYTSQEGGDAAPINRGAAVGLVSINEDTEGAIDLHTAQVSGAFTLAGETPPGSTADDGVVMLQGETGGTALLGNTHDAAYSARVLVGAYEVVYAQETASLNMPGNTHAVLTKAEVVSDDSLSIDIPVVEVTGTLTIDGDEAPNSPYDDGRLYLRNAETRDSVLLGNTRLGTYAARIVPGTYDVVYENEFSDTLLPLNRGAIVRSGVQINPDQSTLDINIPVSVLSGEVEIDGSIPSLDEGLGQLFLVDQASGDEIFIGHTGATAFTRPLTDGVYMVQYRGVAAEGASLGTSLPANSKASFACIEVVSE
ncbi:MAG: hypothetical protein AAGA54_06115 [Myxococcota bacterium]